MTSVTGYDMDSLLVSFRNPDPTPRPVRQSDPTHSAARHKIEARPGAAKSRTSISRKNRATQRRKEYFRQQSKQQQAKRQKSNRQQPKQTIAASSATWFHGPIDTEIASVQVKKEVYAVGIQTDNEGARMPFANLFPKHLNAAPRTIMQAGYTVFHVRIGQSQAFADMLATTAIIVNNRASAIVMTIALEEVYCHIKEGYVASKGIFSDKLKTYGSHAIPLNPYQTFNIYGINLAMYNSEKLQFLPVTPDQVIRSCIRQCTQTGVPEMIFYESEEELWTRISSSDGDILIDVARFMSCYIDASIYALLTMSPTAGLWTKHEVDDYVTKRILQRLLQSHREVTPDILNRLHLDYQQMQKVIPQVELSELMRHLQPFFSRCGLRPNLQFTEMPSFPLLLNSVPDFQETIYNAKDLTVGAFQEHRLISSLDLQEPPLELMTQITHQCLTNSLFGANSSEDPFLALRCSRFVNPEDSDQDLFKTRFGPLELPPHDSFLTFCIMTDRFMKSQTKSQPNFVGNDEALEIMFGKKEHVKLSHNVTRNIQ